MWDMGRSHGPSVGQSEGIIKDTVSALNAAVGKKIAKTVFAASVKITDGVRSLNHSQSFVLVADINSRNGRLGSAVRVG